MSEAPTVTVLIPARNEEADIERCLRAVLAQDHPHDRMEIVLVDGGSTDRTAEISVRVLTEGDIPWRILDNPVGTTPSNLNAGLAVATGEYLCRVDARSIVPADYVRVCVEILAGCSEVAVTGGAQVAVARDESAMSVGIARALNNRYAMGGSRYRSGAQSGPADTVYLGTFRTHELSSAGGWDNAMLSNQDYELNRRLGREKVVWYERRLRVGYLPRRRLPALVRQYHRFGRWKVRYWAHAGDRPQRRQWLALAVVTFAVVAIPGCWLYYRPPTRRVVWASVVGALLLGVVERRGCSGPDGGWRARCCATACIPLIVGSWYMGVVREAAARKIWAFCRSTPA